LFEESYGPQRRGEPPRLPQFAPERDALDAPPARRLIVSLEDRQEPRPPQCRRARRRVRAFVPLQRALQPLPPLRVVPPDLPVAAESSSQLCSSRRRARAPRVP